MAVTNAGGLGRPSSSLTSETRILVSLCFLFRLDSAYLDGKDEAFYLWVAAQWLGCKNTGKIVLFGMAGLSKQPAPSKQDTRQPFFLSAYKYLI